MAIFDKTFIDNLPDDNLLALREICVRFFSIHESLKDQQSRLKKHDFYIDSMAFIISYSESHDITLFIKFPVLEKEMINNINAISSKFYEMQSIVRDKITLIELGTTFENSKNKFDDIFRGNVFYEFSEEDIEKIQSLISELREEITKSKLFEEDHKNRLLKRLEKLQSELHKKMSDLNRFYVLIGDAGVVFGKFGEDAKPFFDRIQEILQFAWKAQAITEQLPSKFRNKFLSGKISPKD